MLCKTCLIRVEPVFDKYVVPIKNYLLEVNHILYNSQKINCLFYMNLLAPCYLYYFRYYKKEVLVLYFDKTNESIISDLNRLDLGNILLITLQNKGE